MARIRFGTRETLIVFAALGALRLPMPSALPMYLIKAILLGASAKYCIINLSVVVE